MLLNVSLKSMPIPHLFLGIAGWLPLLQWHVTLLPQADCSPCRHFLPPEGTPEARSWILSSCMILLSAGLEDSESLCTTQMPRPVLVHGSVSYSAGGSAPAVQGWHASFINFSECFLCVISAEVCFLQLSYKIICPWECFFFFPFATTSGLVQCPVLVWNMSCSPFQLQLSPGVVVLKDLLSPKPQRFLS